MIPWNKTCNLTYDDFTKEENLDLKVKLNNDRILNFEVQVIDEKNWPERSLSYACRTFDQLMQGEDYIKAKPVYHIGFLDFDLKHLSPEFYATFKLLNVKSHEIYSDKFILSVVNLKAQENTYVSDAAETLLQSNQDLKIRSYCEAVEEARRVRRGLERLVAEKDEALAEKEKAIQNQAEALKAQAAELAHLKALLATKQ